MKIIAFLSTIISKYFQVDKHKFNRGMLFNVGFDVANSDFDDWDCFIFHDVDLLPETSRIRYSCAKDAPKELLKSMQA